MNIDILYKPDSSVAKVTLEEGESIIAEAGAMICMSTNLTMETKTNHTNDPASQSGILATVAKVGKRALGGESLFQNKFTSTAGSGEILLAQPLQGDIDVLDLPSSGIYLKSSSYIACSDGTKVEGQLGGFKSFFGLGGIFILKAEPFKADQKLIFGSFGAIYEMEIDGSITVDNGHLVAWEGTLEYTIQKACDGLIASYFSGEGLICNFTGSGKIWLQTREPISFGQSLSSYLATY